MFFSGSPLILSGSELEDFIVYNLGDRDKGTKFLQRMEQIVDKKEKGNFIISQSEMKNNVEAPETIKGYVPPEILIPKLENEIQTSKTTLDNINDLELFFKTRKKKFNIFEKLKSEKRKITIKKNLPLINKFNNNDNDNNSNFSMEHLSPIARKNSFLYNDNSSEKKILSNDKSTLFIFSKLPSNDKNKKKFSVASHFSYEKNLRKSNFSHINLFGNNLNRRFTNAHQHHNFRGFLQNNSVDEKNNIQSNNNSFLNISKDEKLKERINKFKNEKNKLDSNNKLKKRESLFLNLSDNYNILSPQKKSQINLKKNKKIFDKNEAEQNLLQTEKIFN